MAESAVVDRGGGSEKLLEYLYYRDYVGWRRQFATRTRIVRSSDLKQYSSRYNTHKRTNQRTTTPEKRNVDES
jgi:hypothetical protein